MTIRFIIFLSSFLLFANATITEKQIKVISDVYNTCKMYHANDGMDFRNTCAAIAIRESSAGKVIIGDQGKYPNNLVNSSLGAMQIRVKTVQYVLYKNLELRKKYNKYFHKNIDVMNKYLPIMSSMNYYKSKYESAENAYKYAKGDSKEFFYNQYIVYRHLYIKARNNFLKYRKYYRKDLAVAQRLLTDNKFAATIAANYLIINYELAKSRNMEKPYLRAISRYNGGWNNRRYIKAVLKDMKTVEWLKRHKKLKGLGD